MKNELINIVNEIGLNIIDYKSYFDESFLLPSGKIGASLFLYYAGEYLRSDKLLECSYNYFEESFNALSSFGEKIKGKTLFGGYTGVLWLYQHYINVEFIEYNENSKDIFQTFDELIEKECSIVKQTKNYDLLYGLLGYGVYFLERNKFTPQHESLNDIVNLLDEIAIKKDYGSAWEDKFDRKENKHNELINLGFAHGTPSVIVFLAYVYKETRNDKALNLIHQAVNFLKYHELDISEGSIFSYHVLDDKPYSYPSRLAWCYGDLGIGYAIIKTGVLISNKNYIEYGENILISLTNRTLQDETTGVKDAGFCHGAAGIAHLFNKAFQYSKNERFYKASKYWMETTIKMQNSDGSYSRCHYIDKEEKWQYAKDNGLIEGASGVGLSMLSYLEPTELSWDLCFLL